VTVTRNENYNVMIYDINVSLSMSIRVLNSQESTQSPQELDLSPATGRVSGDKYAPAGAAYIDQIRSNVMGKAGEAIVEPRTALWPVKIGGIV